MLPEAQSQIPITPIAVPARSGPRRVAPAVDLDATLPLGETARLRAAPEVLPMRCLRCQGPVQRGTAPVRVERDGYRMAWEKVPAWVCSRCDLAYFEPHEVGMIRRSLNALRGLKSDPQPQT